MLKQARKPRFLMMSFSLLAMLMLVLNACGVRQLGDHLLNTSSGTPVKGGTWIDDLYEEPDSLISNFSSETFASMVMDGLYAGLVYGTPQGQLMPGLVT